MSHANKRKTNRKQRARVIQRLEKKYQAKILPKQQFIDLDDLRLVE